MGLRKMSSITTEEYKEELHIFFDTINNICLDHTLDKDVSKAIGIWDFELHYTEIGLSLKGLRLFIILGCIKDSLANVNGFIGFDTIAKEKIFENLRNHYVRDIGDFLTIIDQLQNHYRYFEPLIKAIELHDSVEISQILTTCFIEKLVQYSYIKKSISVNTIALRTAILNIFCDCGMSANEACARLRDVTLQYWNTNPVAERVKGDFNHQP